MKVYTTQEITEKLPIGRSTVNKLALENDIGLRGGRERLFTEEDLETLKALVKAMPGRGGLGKPRRPRQPKQAADQP